MLDLIYNAKKKQVLVTAVWLCAYTISWQAGIYSLDVSLVFARKIIFYAAILDRVKLGQV